MRVKILRNLGIGGKFHSPGDVVEVSKSLGLELIGGNRAVLADGEEEPKVPEDGFVKEEPKSQKKSR